MVVEHPDSCLTCGICLKYTHPQLSARDSTQANKPKSQHGYPCFAEFKTIVLQ